MSQAGISGTGTSGFVTQITTDNGIVTPALGNINLYADTAINNGTLKFTGTGSTVQLHVTDASNNTTFGLGSAFAHFTTASANSFFGNNAGTLLTSGGGSCGFGADSLLSLTTGSNCVAVGEDSLGSLVSGNRSVGIGNSAGTNYTTNESDNIIIGWGVGGTVGESNVVRIGRGTGTGIGQINATYIQGISGRTVANTQVVTIDTTTGQLGSAALSSLVKIDGDTGSSINNEFTFTATDSVGGSAAFASSGGIITLSVTDAGNNTFIGASAGNGTVTGIQNSSLGESSLQNITSGDENFAGGYNTLKVLSSGEANVVVGYNSASQLDTGSLNVILGADSGNSYTTNEDSNILIGWNIAGTATESNVCRIGKATGTGDGELNATLIQGIAGRTVSNLQTVTIDTSTGQLGSAAFVVDATKPAFLAYLNSTQNNVTGDGTVYTIPFGNEKYDQGANFNTGTGTFTAPVTGVYSFQASANLSGLSLAFTSNLDLVCTGQTYRIASLALAASAGDSIVGSATVKMTAGDTATIAITATLAVAAATVNVVGGASPIVTYFSGALL